MSAATARVTSILELDRISVSDRAVSILSDVSTCISRGALTAVIGPNGSGKTTLLRVVAGLIAPTEGRLQWAGSVPRRAIVFQRPVMLRRSVGGNMGFALAAAGIPKHERLSRAGSLLELVGLKAFWSRSARQLSAGEQHRLAVARALAREPELLLLDEPTASLDPAATRSLEELIQTIVARGTTVMMATHDLGQARRLAQDVVLLHRGHVVEAAPARAFFDAPNTSEARDFVNGNLLL